MAIRTYKVTLDSKNTIAPEPVYLRQGDKTGAVVIDATLMDNGSPVSLDGLAPMFKANTADGQAVIADSTGFNIVNASGGEFTYQVPNALSSVPGKITTAYFSLSDSSGSESTFDVAFIIKKAVDVTQTQADDYIAIVDGTLKTLQQKIDAMNTDVQTILNAFNQGDFYNKAQTDSKDAATLSSAEKYADLGDSNALHNAKTYTDNSLSGIVALPETFINLAAIQSKYPNGSNGIMVAADNGHKYIWANSTWTDAGIYQSTGIADSSIEPIKLVIPSQNNGINKDAYFPLVKTSILNNLRTDPTSPKELLSLPLSISVDNADLSKVYILTQICHDTVANKYGAKFAWAPRLSNNSFDANNAVDLSGGSFSSMEPSVDQYGHVTLSYKFDETTITITYKTPTSSEAKNNVFGDVNGKTYFDASVIDVSNYHYSPNQRGLLKNYNVNYPLVEYVVPGNAITPASKASDIERHRKAIVDIKVINPEPNTSYLINSIKNGLSGGYGVVLAQAPRIDGKSFDKSTVTFFNAPTDLSTTPLIADKDGNVTDTHQFGQTIIEVTYNLNWVHEGNDNRPNLAFFDGNSYFNLVLIDEATFIKLPSWINTGVSYKKPTWLGDSITANYDYANVHYNDIIAKKWGSTISTNMGIGGSTVGNLYDPMSVRYLDIPTDTDFISVFGGVNDYGRDQPLGQYGDTTNTTFYGALHVLLNGLQTKFPTVPKIFISPQHIGAKFVNHLGFTQDQYEEAIIKMTSKFSIPHLSLFSDMGVTFEVDAQANIYSVDSLHPNNAGHEIIADKILKFLN